ncbi:MAG: type II toxin-antitoxin system HicA family toxin [Dehalococcoidia bacterium]
MVPLCSSKEVVAALHRAGFVEKGSSGGSHQGFVGKDEGGHERYTVVQLGAREIPRSTLRSILRQSGITEDAFLALLGKNPPRGKAGKSKKASHRQKGK